MPLAVASVVILILWIAIVLLLARFVIEWIGVFARSWTPRGWIAVLCEGIYVVTDPPLRAIRRLIPPLRLGQVYLDLSPLILLIVLQILISVVRATAF
ncbi:MAG: YggT family protein [Aeromicrobium sp.]|uniref:YggT family protein n=1 Tax=Aeromicrobium sp. TaxID=1871063 RepID=UPI0039E3139E